METVEKRHYAVIDPYTSKLTVTFGETVIAETQQAMILKEVGRSVYDPVFYIPKEDIRVDLKREAETKGFCPIKGHAHRWHLPNQETGAYFGWSYEDPLPKAHKIKGKIAFNKAFVSFLSEPLEKH